LVVAWCNGLNVIIVYSRVLSKLGCHNALPTYSNLAMQILLGLYIIYSRVV
jgi:hypothetical protein